MSTNKTFNKVQLDVKFTQATSRANLISEENISISFGKISKYFADLHSQAFTGYAHPTYIARTGKPTGNQTPGFGSTFTISQITSDGTGHVTAATDRTVKIPDTTMGAASADAAGSKGLVPAPAAGKQTSFLRGDGTWVVPTNTDTKVTQGFATQSSKRPLLMSYYKVGEETGTAQVAYRNDSLYCNPSNGRIFATGFYTSGWGTSPASTSASLQENGLALRAIKTYGDGHTLDYSRYVVRTYSGKTGLSTSDWSSNGMLVTVDGGGLTIVGGGESAASLAGLISDDYLPASGTPNSLDVNGDTTTGTGYLHTSLSGSSENLILSADTDIYFVTNVNTTANRKAARLTSNLYFTPLSTNTGSIGTSTYQWNTIYGETLYENGTSLASKYAAIGHTHTTTIAADSGTNQLTLAASTKYKLTAGETNFIFTTPPNTTYSAGNHLSLSSTTFSLASYCKSITDWNSATTNGWYMGSSVTNAPSTEWWMGRVIAHNNKYCIQEVWNFSVSAPDNANPDAMYMSHKKRWFRAEHWGPWVDVSTPTPSAKVNCDFGTVASRTTNVTRGWIAFWDGSYNNGSSSNLTYCNQGAFGTIVTKNTGDYVPNTQAGVNAAINLLSTGSSTPALADYYVSQYASGGTTTTTYHRRPISALWNAFKELITLTTTGSGNAVTAVSIANDGDHNRKITVTKGSTFSLDGHDNKCTVTNGSTTSTNYGIVFAVNPDTTENNTLRKTNDFRYQMKDGAANTEGFASIILGNTKKLSEANNKSGNIYLYSSGGNWHLINTTSTTSNITHTLPATSGTILNSGTTSFTRTLSSGTKIGTIKINGTSTDLYCQTNTNTTYSAGTGLSLSGTTFNHSNSVTAKDNYNKKFFTHDAQGHITGTSWCIHDASGTNGSNNDTTWIKIATLVHTDTYNNSPITITFTQRGYTVRNRLTIRFSSVNSKDPSLALFLLTCDELWTLSNSRALIVKTATSTWDIYIKKLDTYELIHISDFDIGSTGSTKLTWTWKDEQVSTTPADATEATKKVYSTTDHTHSYAGSSSVGGAATSANKLNTNAGASNNPVYFSGGVPVACNVPAGGSWFNGGIPEIRNGDGVMEIGRYIDFHATNGSTADYDYRIETSTTAMLLTTGGSSSNTLIIKSSGNTQLSFQTASSGKAYTAPGIICYPLSTSGMTTLFNFGGNLVIGGGESAKTLYDNNYDTIKTAENEDLYLCADNDIHIVTGCKTYADKSIIEIDALGKVYLPTTGGIIVKQRSDSNYVSATTWWKGGTAPESGEYAPHIGQHNTGGDSSYPGSICILPYKSTTNPWGGTVGLFIRKDHVYIDGVELSKSTHTHNYAGSSSAGGDATNANAANVTVTDVPSTSTSTDAWKTSYGILFAQNPNTTQSNTLRKSHNLRFYHGPNGTADTVGVGELIVGNSTASGTAGNMQGRLILYSSSSSYISMVPAATSSARTITLPAATGSVILGTKGSTSYYGLMDGNASTANWIRATSNGFIPSASAKFFQTATSSLGTNSWYFNNSYIQNMTANRLVLGAAKTADGAAKGQLKFFSGNGSDATGTVTLECADDAVHTGDYTVKLPTWNGTIPVFEKLFEGASNTVSLSYSDIDEYDVFLITVANSNATSEPVTVTSLWISNVAGVHDMPLIWGGAPTSSGGSCNVTSGWIQLSKNSGTTTFVVAHKSNVAQMTSSGWTISSPTYNLYIRKIFGLKAFKRT